MKNSVKIIKVALALATVMLFSSCNNKLSGTVEGGQLPDISDEMYNLENTFNSVFEGVNTFPIQPKSAEYTTDTGITVIKLADSNIQINGEGAVAEGSTLTIINQGTYLLSGSLTDGKIVVDTQDSEKVKLILNGVSVTSSESAVCVLNAPKKVIFNSVAGSVNIFTDGTDYIIPDEEQIESEIYPNACIYSTADLKFSGDGEIYIKSNSGKGINSKDDIEISSGSITVSAADDGIRGNDSVEILSGNITVISGADGIKSSNSDKEGKGYILVSGGNVNIKSAADALQAETKLTISDGTLNLLCANGCDTSSLQNTTTAPDAYAPGGHGGRPGGPGGFGGMGGMDEGNTQKPDYSCKGIKSAGDISISGGTFTISTPDDAIHSDTSLTVSGGLFKIAAGDDGFHAEDSLIIDNGEINILTSYEGIEAVVITVNGGKILLASRDDGFNACGGTSMMGSPGGFGGSSASDTESDVTPTLTFNGGEVILDADGDGVDSNGNIIMTGGNVIVYGPTNNGNGAIDYGDRIYNMTISGGRFLAVGASGMAETAQGDGQGVIGVRMGNISADSTVKITDEKGNTVIEFITPKAMGSLVYSSPDIVSGDNYTISVNSQELGTIAAG